MAVNKEKDKTLTHDEIAKRAYELYLQRSEDGYEIENWLFAEEELRQRKQESSDPLNTEDVPVAAIRRNEPDKIIANELKGY